MASIVSDETLTPKRFSSELLIASERAEEEFFKSGMRIASVSEAGGRVRRVAEGSELMMAPTFSARAPGTSQSWRQRRRALASDFFTMQVMPSSSGLSGECLYLRCSFAPATVIASGNPPADA